MCNLSFNQEKEIKQHKCKLFMLGEFNLTPETFEEQKQFCLERINPFLYLFFLLIGAHPIYEEAKKHPETYNLAKYLDRYEIDHDGWYY